MKETNDESVPTWEANGGLTAQTVSQKSSLPGVTAGNNPASPFESLSGLLPDLVCFSHLRWNFVFQRPQHLMTRFTKHLRVFFVEEPHWDAAPGGAWLEVQTPRQNLWVVVPHLPDNLKRDEQEQTITQLLKPFFAERQIDRFVSWYYTPMALGFSKGLEPLVTVYDCMDELSAFRGAPPILLEREAELFTKADLVFTGGQSLYEAKRERHPRVYAFPSSIEQAHFAHARQAQADPDDQAAIPHPRMGFYGVLDERFDIELLRDIAGARPDWHFVMIGPVVKIHPDELPKAVNIHYPGMKSYEELPRYLAGWDVALLLFALNESTRFISPTKTPEYLAAGKPVVSTPIRDVVRPYGDAGLVHIAGTVEEMESAITRALGQADDAQWLNAVDAFLKQNSWDITWTKMATLITEAINSTLKNR